MIHYRPEGYPEPHIPAQTRFLSEKWDAHQGVPEEAENQRYDSSDGTIAFEVGGETFSFVVSTPPLWIGKDTREWKVTPNG